MYHKLWCGCCLNDSFLNPSYYEGEKALNSRVTFCITNRTTTLKSAGLLRRLGLRRGCSTTFRRLAFYGSVTILTSAKQMVNADLMDAVLS